MKEVIYLPEADDDLVGIWNYTADEWGEEQADRYVLDIRARIEAIAAGHAVSRSAEDVRAGLRRILAEEHVVFFREDADTVTVVRVLHQRMDVRRD